MTLHAITVLGHDRPGIIAETTDRIAGLGLNLEDSSMTRLRGHFAMTLICAGDADAGAIREALAPLTEEGTLSVTVHEVPEERVEELGGTLWVLSVHGGDRPGIVSAVAGVVAAAGGNITDLTTRLAGDLYVVVAEVELPDGADAGAVSAELRDVAARLGVGATLRPADTDEL